MSAVALVLALVPFTALAASPVSALPTENYPSWDDVLKAQQDEKSTQALVAQIQASITSLQAQVEETQRVAKEKGEIYAQAQTAYDEQAYIAQQLGAQADAARAQAEQSQRTAGELVAQLAQTGGTDLTAALIADAGSADSLLYRLGATSMLSERFAGVYEQAAQQQKNAESLTAQAKVATDKLAELKAAAEAAFQEAQAAADAVADKLSAQLAKQQELQAQLDALIQKRKTTEADYQKGLEAQWGAGSGGQVSADGWALPAAGRITSPFGNRPDPFGGGGYTFHTGTDLAGGGCSAPIYAAHAGTVVYAGWYGVLGNLVRIDHGNGIVTGYGHIVNGGTLVHVGQQVAPGQLIAKQGMTGTATGCHLHFMVYVNGVLTDPVPFMRTHGIQLGR